jgi:hypothetical protein
VRIALRTSGGRGEYELAGHQASIAGASLLDKQLDFQLSPELVIAGHQTARHRQGKPRIRLDEPSALHAYRFLTGALLLPKPKREKAATSTVADFVHDNMYSITGIDVDVVDAGASSVLLRPTTLWLENAAGLVRGIDVTERMALVQAIWDVARSQNSPLAEQVRAHEAAVLGGDHKEIEKAGSELRIMLPGDGDPIEPLARELGADVGVEAVALGSIAHEFSEEGEQDETDPAEAARRAVAKWRKSVQRSAQARRFSDRVRLAYGDRCAVSGAHLPKLSSTASPGVEGAHILPWARYELNTLKNGICLNKLCHWAFDAGVIRIDYDAGDYVVSIPEQVSAAAVLSNMDLGYFEQFVGPIPRERLPADSSHHPSSNYLAQLNTEMYG